MLRFPSKAFGVLTGLLLLPSLIMAQNEPNHINLAANGTDFISSPSYPGSYQNNLDIQWIIQTVQDFRILLSFYAFITERNDHLSAGDGIDSANSSTMLLYRSGSSVPPDTRSNGNAMWLRFTSDGFGTRSGFSLSARSVGSSCVLNSCLNSGTCQPMGWSGFTCECLNGFIGTRCEIKLNNLAANQSITITSPSYPSNYPSNLDIQWVIQAAEGQRIILSFHAFNTESGYDYLEVGNGRDSTDSSTRVFRWSGSSLPPDTLSTGNAMWLRFTSDSATRYEGFSLSARSIGSLATVTTPTATTTTPATKTTNPAATTTSPAATTTTPATTTTNPAVTTTTPAATTTTPATTTTNPAVTTNTPSAASTVTITTLAATTKAIDTLVGKVAGGAAAGGVLLVVILLLIFLIRRCRKNNSQRTVRAPDIVLVPSALTDTHIYAVPEAVYDTNIGGADAAVYAN